jgi:tRNA(Ile)-lysidine synthetase-like protein
MLFQLTHPLPKKNQYYLACSGGVDSIAAFIFLKKGNRLPAGLIYVDHNTKDYSKQAAQLVKAYSISNNIAFYGMDIQSYELSNNKGSKENYWREERYKAFSSIQAINPLPIVLGHHLDDCLEQYVINKFIRFSKTFTIRYRGPSNTIRPFRTWKKKSMIEYVDRSNHIFLEDPSNQDVSFTRNKVRHEIIPKLLEINPGLYNHVIDYIMQEASKEKGNLII